jgi:hypothetical protein
MPKHKEMSLAVMILIAGALVAGAVSMAIGIAAIAHTATSPTPAVNDYCTEEGKPSYAATIMCLNCGTEHKAEFTVGVAVPDELTHICPNCQLNTALVPKHLTTQPAEKEKQP